MPGFRAKVKGGRLSLDEPTSLPEGTVLDLAVDDEGDDLTGEDRQVLNQAIQRAWEYAREGNEKPAKVIVDELRARSK